MRVGSHLAQVNYANKTQNTRKMEASSKIEDMKQKPIFLKKDHNFLTEVINHSGLNDHERVVASLTMVTAPIHTKMNELMGEAVKRGEKIHNVMDFFRQAGEQVGTSYQVEGGLQKAIKNAQELRKIKTEDLNPWLDDFLDKLLEAVKQRDKSTLDIKV